MSVTETVETVVTPRKSTYKLSFFKILRSEWIKLFTLRSTWWILGMTLITSIGICVVILFAMRVTVQMLKGDLATAGMPPSTLEPGGLGMLSEFVAQGCGFVGQLVFVILSILIITNEYSSGMIRSTLSVAPRRNMVLVSKMIVIGVTCVVVFALAVAASWGIGYVLLHDASVIDVTLISGTSVRILGGFIAEMVLIAFFAFGLGVFIRSSAGSIGAALGILMVLPMIMNIVTSIIWMAGEPVGWRKWLIDAAAFLPTTAGGLVTQASVSESSLLGPWEGLGILGAWAFLVLLVAFISINKRDV